MRGGGHTIACNCMGTHWQSHVYVLQGSPMPYPDDGDDAFVGRRQQLQETIYDDDGEPEEPVPAHGRAQTIPGSWGGDRHQVRGRA